MIITQEMATLQTSLFKTRFVFIKTFSRCCLLHPKDHLIMDRAARLCDIAVRSRGQTVMGVRRQHEFPIITQHVINDVSSEKQRLHSRGIKSDHSLKSFVNPLSELQKFVSVPILSEEKAPFCPSSAEIDKAMLIFQGPGGSNVKNPVKFVGSFVDGSQVPDLNLPEVCFLGRSNVGKSSLISVLLSAHPQVSVRVSKKPGHTKTINLFRMGRRFTLIDMPGYGHNMPKHFQQSVETYLSNSRRLCRTFLLLDGEVGLTSSDTIALEMLQEIGVPFVVVLTKIDKAGRHKLIKSLLAVMQTCQEKGGHTCFSQPFLVSSKTGDGVMFLQTFIAYLTGCISVKGL